MIVLKRGKVIVSALRSRFGVARANLTVINSGAIPITSSMQVIVSIKNASPVRINEIKLIERIDSIHFEPKSNRDIPSIKERPTKAKDSFANVKIKPNWLAQASFFMANYFERLGRVSVVRFT